MKHVVIGEEIAQIDATHDQPKWFDDMIDRFAHLIEAGGGMATYGPGRRS